MLLDYISLIFRGVNNLEISQLLAISNVKVTIQNTFLKNKSKRDLTEELSFGWVSQTLFPLS